MKKIISYLLLSSMIFCLVPMAAAAEEDAVPPLKDGYSLVPTLYGKTGVDVSSAFLLTVPLEASIGEIIGALSIDGQPAPLVSQKGKKEFLITPSATLSPNFLYIFRLSRTGKEEITWAFQTAKKFQVISNFPRNQATNVPKNSGIEIIFSSAGYGAIDDYFEISPNVEGKFEYHKETAVFVPKSLAYKTVYTITLKAGIALEGTGDALAGDYTFAFETEAEPSYSPPKYSESAYFYSKYAELPTIEPPQFGFRVYCSDYAAALPNPKISVYKFGSGEKAAEAVEALTGAPGWSRYAKEKELIGKNGLSKVMSFEAKDGYDDQTNTLTLPDCLTQGFYLIEAALKDSKSQMIVQINDLPVQLIADSEKTILWVNDIETKKASAGAAIQDVKEGKTYTADADGIAVIDRAIEFSRDCERFDITSTDGKVCIWLYRGYGYGTGGANEAYWSALQLDRSLYKRDDAVSFFGFVQERKNTEQIKNVTAVLTRGYYSYGYYGTRDILQKQTVPVSHGAYSDEMQLPNLDAGSYNLTIYCGDVALASTYFTVQDYVKPPYKIEVSADKKAAFLGETVTFFAKAGFFEGTPVADLDISYNVYGYDLDTSGNGRAKTDLDGAVEISEKIAAHADAQGQTSLGFTAEATLPEIGRTAKSASVRAFINDIEVFAMASRTKKEAKLTANVSSITLDRLNDGTAKNYHDYLDAPVSGKPLSVEIYRVYYDKKETGSYYDYIEKKVRTTYRYERKEQSINAFTMVTDKEGNAEKSFTVPDRQYESYFAKISCIDGNGRKITQCAYIGHDYYSYWQNVNTDSYFLEMDEEANAAYDVGETVKLTLKRGSAEVTSGNFLFVAMQRGIQSWQAGKNPYSFEFSKEHIPNVTVNAYYFNGYNYQSGYYMSKTIYFDYLKNDLELSASTDKDSYKPGDSCTVTVTAKDASGNLKKDANVNISIVDEALFALRDYHVDTLALLYRAVSSGLKFAASTHRAYVPSFDDELNEEAMPEAEAPSAAPSPGGGDGDDAYLREIFKDTAFFATMQTNRQGEAVYTFKLPDNITSWRLTMSAVSEDLYAGNATANIIVTNPMFLNYTLNNEFLAGDIPTIGVNAYGTSLSGGEKVDFEVWDESRPDKKYKASGAAFERVNIPLWKMENEGANALVIKATVDNGTSDAVRHQYQVLATYREIDEAMYCDVSLSTKFEVGSGGLTNITFTDQGRGAFLHQLLCMLRGGYGGDRIEKMLAHREAAKLLSEYFPDVHFGYCNINFEPKSYQQKNGGLSILPHAESDLETTVKLIDYIKGEINANSLKNYLYMVYEGENAENKMCALYGLALLGEPVLLELGGYAMQDNISVKDAVYIALGYCALGEKETASELYDGRVAPNLEQMKPYFRVNAGEDQDDVLTATSAANLLATKLEKPEKEGLYRYCIDNYATDILTNIEKLSHIKQEIAKRTEVKGKIRYTLFGEEFTRELENGSSYTLEIPARNMAEFKLVEVTGSVGAVSVIKKPMEEIGEIDGDITVVRRYYEANEYKNSSESFKQGDLVRVQLWIDYTKKAMDGSYCVTDYLPAGLEYVSGSAKIEDSPDFGYGYYRYCKVEGQKITFYDYNGRFDQGCMYYYYARVINPGKFLAEGTFVQNLAAKDCFTIGEDSAITIE
ncbi:MAG: Ig-like domain-containing protein [Oscillospiraceae bacterium]|nr:Ig-like domain-containing protein [Oscillospiraceae bacterium]